MKHRSFFVHTFFSLSSHTPTSGDAVLPRGDASGCDPTAKSGRAGGAPDALPLAERTLPAARLGGRSGSAGAGAPAAALPLPPVRLNTIPLPLLPRVRRTASSDSARAW